MRPIRLTRTPFAEQSRGPKIASTLFLALILALIAVASLAGSALADATLTVGTKTPAPNATDVAVGTSVTATFSSALDKTTVTNSTFTLTKDGSSTPVAANFTYNTAGTKVTLNPSTNLDPGAKYNVTIKGGDSGVKDTNGNTLANDVTWSFTTGPNTYQENDSARTDYGLWAYYTDSHFSGGYSAYSNFTNDSATFSFTGTSVTWKTDKLPDGGITDVYLDGNKVATFDGYAATSAYKVTGFTQSGLTSGDHTLKLVVTGNKNPASAGNFTEIDNFVVGNGTFQENSPDVCYGTWCGKRDTSASGGTYRYNSSTSQSAWFYSFTGPYVELLTARGPTRGNIAIKVYDASNYALVKEVDQNLNDTTLTTDKFKVPVRVEGLDPSKEYYLTVTSTDGKEAVVDGYNAFPYQTPVATPTAQALSATTDNGAKKPHHTNKKSAKGSKQQLTKGSRPKSQ